MTDISELIERVKAATGPDRWLSRDIWQSLDTPEWKRAYILAQEPCGCPHDQAVEYAARHLADVTASIDAALALVERLLPGVLISMASHLGDGTEWQVTLTSEAYCYAALARTLPLALLSALLLSLQSEADK